MGDAMTSAPGFGVGADAVAGGAAGGVGGGEVTDRWMDCE
jgi:hypothetical protein